MQIFCIGDLHLSLNKAVDKPMDEFGEVWENHHIKLEENWKEVVNEGDIVVLVGDISWGLKLEEAKTDFEFLDSLPGKKILIKGNHDLWWNGITKLNKMYEDMFFLQNTAVDLDKFVICGTRGWLCPGDPDFKEADLKIYKREGLRLEASLKEGLKTGKEILAFVHYPPTNDKWQSSIFTDLFEQYNVKEVYFGHLHTKAGFKKALQGYRNGVNYKLISYDYLKGNLYKVK